MRNNKSYETIELQNSYIHKNIKLKDYDKINYALVIKFLGLLNMISILVIIFILFIEKEKLINKIIGLTKYELNKSNGFKNINNSVFGENKNLSMKDVKIINENEIILCQENKFYIKKLIFNISEFIFPMKVFGKNKIRIGNKGDGGYILLDDFDNIKIAYSFGISNEISFEKELADKNIDIFMYDHTIEKLQYKNSRFHWKKIGLTGDNNQKENMKTIVELLTENGHINEQNMILKLDIELGEWEVFKNLHSNILNKFKYIVGEFHFNLMYNINYYDILKKFQNTHQVFHLHCNNCGNIIDLYGYKICGLLEISFIRKEGYQFIEDNSTYPIEGLDYKNCKNKKEINYIINILNELNN